MGFVVYSKKLRNYLLSKGFKEIKEPETNLKYPKFLVFFFDDSKELRQIVEDYKNV
nr:MAG TPA: hypothetical protein [Caudoviricetes sp.]